MFRLTASFSLHFASCITSQQTPHFWGCTSRRGYDPQIWTRLRFLYNALIPQVFSCLEVIMFKDVLTNRHTSPHTNKQMLLKTSNVIRYATMLGKNCYISTSVNAPPSARQYPLITFPSTTDNIRVMVIVWSLRGSIITTAVCWIVWHNVHSLQHTYMSSSYRSNRLGLSHWDPYSVCRGGCLELYYCNMVEWFKPDLDDQLVFFSALTLLVWSSDL